MSAHLRQKFQQRKLGLITGGALLPAAGGSASEQSVAATAAGAGGQVHIAADLPAQYSIGNTCGAGAPLVQQGAAQQMQEGRLKESALPPPHQRSSSSSSISSSSSLPPGCAHTPHIHNFPEQWQAAASDRSHFYSTPNGAVTAAPAQHPQQGQFECTYTAVRSSLTQQHEHATSISEAGEALYNNSSSSSSFTAATRTLPYSRGGRRHQGGGGSIGRGAAALRETSRAAATTSCGGYTAAATTETTAAATGGGGGGAAAAAAPCGVRGSTAAGGDRYAVGLRERSQHDGAYPPEDHLPQQSYESPWQQQDPQQRYLQQQQQRQPMVVGNPASAAAVYDRTQYGRGFTYDSCADGTAVPANAAVAGDAAAAVVAGDSSGAAVVAGDSCGAAVVAPAGARVEAAAWRRNHMFLLPPSGLPLQHISLLVVPLPAGAAAVAVSSPPSNVGDLFPFVLRALLQHPSVLPHLLVQQKGNPTAAAITPAAGGGDMLQRRHSLEAAVTDDLVEEIVCSIDIPALRQQVKQMLPRGGSAGGAAAAAPLAVQKLLRPDNILAILQSAAATSKGGTSSPPPTSSRISTSSSNSTRRYEKVKLGQFEELPYALLELTTATPGGGGKAGGGGGGGGTATATTTVSRLYPLRICAALYAVWFSHEQQKQQQKQQQEEHLKKTKKKQQEQQAADMTMPSSSSNLSHPADARSIITTGGGGQDGGGVPASVLQPGPHHPAVAGAGAACAGAVPVILTAQHNILPSTNSTCFMPAGGGTPAAHGFSYQPPPPPPEPPYSQQQQQQQPFPGFCLNHPSQHAITTTTPTIGGGHHHHLPPQGAQSAATSLRPPPPPPPPAPPPPDAAGGCSLPHGGGGGGGGGGGSALSELCSGKNSTSAAETRKWEEGLEELLSAPTALKQRGLSSGSELSSLLNAPTARQQMVLLSFKNKNGSALREICPSGTRADCCRSRHSFVPCKKVHFRRIILAHTDVTLGDCSYLDTCRHIETCKYVHYEVDDPSTSEVLKKRREGSVDPYAIGAISAGTYEEFPAQWIRCDIRTFDFSIFRRLIRVVMADPPWDIHMDLPYGTMTDQEMRSLRVDLIQEEGLLFLWVTGRAMEVARECLELWGYRRVEEILWVKTNQLQRIIRTGRTGHWLNHSKEHCLVGIKGENFPLNRNIDCDVIVSEVRETSRKPDEIYRIIERMCPDTLKVELFGRMHNVRNNWITLGNQLKGVKLEHPLLIERYNTFAPTVGLPLATLSGAPPATAGNSTTPSVGADTEVAEGNMESTSNSNSDAPPPSTGVSAELGDTEVEESPPAAT